MIIKDRSAKKIQTKPMWTVTTATELYNMYTLSSRNFISKQSSRMLQPYKHTARRYVIVKKYTRHHALS